MALFFYCYYMELLFTQTLIYITATHNLWLLPRAPSLSVG